MKIFVVVALGLTLAAPVVLVVYAGLRASPIDITNLSACELGALIFKTDDSEFITRLDVRRARSSCEVTPKKVEVASQRQQIEALLKEKRASEAASNKP